jgi:hypothetical protein
MFAIWRSCKLAQSGENVYSFKLMHLTKIPFLPLVKSINLNEGTRLQLQRLFFKPDCASLQLRQSANIYPKASSFPVTSQQQLLTSACELTKS